MYGKLIKLLNYFFQGIISLIFPPLCIICDIRLTYEKVICTQCWDKLQTANQELIDSKKLPDLIDKLYAAFLFDETFQKIIHALKYSKNKSIGTKIGELSAQNLSSNFKNMSDKTLLIPIPLHPVKYRERGYNQAAEIAQAISKHSSIPVNNRIIKRVKNTATQTKMDREQRIENMQNAFELAAPVPDVIHSVILVDDVFTTGSTMNSAAKILKENGVKQVFAFAAALPE